MSLLEHARLPLKVNTFARGNVLWSIRFVVDLSSIRSVINTLWPVLATLRAVPWALLVSHLPRIYASCARLPYGATSSLR
jgi:hypothetical protein